MNVQNRITSFEAEPLGPRSFARQAFTLRRLVVAEVDVPSHGWFTVDLQRMLADLQDGGGESAPSVTVARSDAEAGRPARGVRPAAEPSSSRPTSSPALPPDRGAGPPRRVPPRDIIVLRRPVRIEPMTEEDVRPAGRIAASAAGPITARTIALAVLLGLSLVGLGVQWWSAQPITIPISLDQQVIVT